jgi:hypothetical protein
MMRDEKIRRLRQWAKTCRSFADHQNTPASRDEFLRRAHDYEERADKLERGPRADDRGGD